MENSIVLKNRLYIGNISLIWKEISPLLTEARQSEEPLFIDLGAVEYIDGAGLQILVLLLSLADEFPEKYKITGITEQMKQWSADYGFELINREVKNENSFRS